MQQNNEKILTKHTQFINEIEAMDQNKDNTLLSESQNKLLEEKRKFMDDLNRSYPKWKEFIDQKKQKLDSEKNKEVPKKNPIE
jgi:hypothetical protein